MSNIEHEINAARKIHPDGYGMRNVCAVDPADDVCTLFFTNGYDAVRGLDLENAARALNACHALADECERLADKVAELESRGVSPEQQLGLDRSHEELMAIARILGLSTSYTSGDLREAAGRLAARVKHLEAENSKLYDEESAVAEALGMVDPEGSPITITHEEIVTRSKFLTKMAGLQA